MSSLVDYYCDVCEANNYTPRRGLMETLKKVQDGKSVILTAPTGYGKTSLTMALALASLKGNDLFDRVIHVLPLRSIVQDLYEKLRSFTEKVGYRPSDKFVGAYDMDFRDSPYFLKKVNVTTLDSFVLNLFKLPVAELAKGLRGLGTHYEVPRAAIYSSIVVFDEFHLFSEDGKALTSALAALRALGSMGVPFIIATATLPPKLKDLTKSKLKEVADLEEVNISESPVDRYINVDIIDEEPDLSLIKKIIGTHKKILIVYNTRQRAIKAYKAFKDAGLKPLLLHSKFNTIDRTKKVQLLHEGKYDLVISTQVIEAGIDVSFDVLYTEAAPLPSMIQRAGRVARYGGSGEVYIFPFNKGSEKVYDIDEVNYSLELVENNKSLDPSLMEGYNFDKYQVDPALLESLEMIDDGPFFSSKLTADLLEAECSLTRETSLIMGFPPDCVSPECAVPLTEHEVQKLLNEGNSAVKIENGARININWSGKITKRCLSIVFIKEGIDGVALPSYDKETGAEI